MTRSDELFDGGGGIVWSEEKIIEVLLVAEGDE